jgi:pyruvate kinase
MMDRIARQTEGHMAQKGRYGNISRVAESERPLADEVAAARSVALLTLDLKIKAVVVISQTGVTAAIVSSTRPAAPVLAVSSVPEAVSRMNLMWGVMPRLAEAGCFDSPEILVRRLVEETKVAEEGDKVLLARGFRASGNEQSHPSVTIITI